MPAADPLADRPRPAPVGVASTIDALPSVSVVIPCHNDQASIRAVVEQALRSPHTSEVVVVDDASSDGTPQIVRGLGERRVRLLEQPRTMGLGAALRRGLVAARAPHLLVLQAGQVTSAADQDAVLRPLLCGEVDVVYGAGGHRPSLADRCLGAVSRALTPIDLTGTTCQALRREVLDALDLEEERGGWAAEALAELAGGPFRLRRVALATAGTPPPGTGLAASLHALYCLGRYRLGRAIPARPPRPDSFAQADGELGDALDSLDGATNYADWICEMAAPYLRGGGDNAILEIGAGHGTLTERLCRHGRVVASDLSPRCVERLRGRFAGNPAIEVVQGDAAQAAVGRKFGSIVLVNVLEHIEDDRAALLQLGELLVPGGHLVILVPAFPALYSNFDQLVGHHRRYRRGGLTALAYRANLDIVEARYVNSLGALAWWLLATRLGRIPTRPWPVRVYDAAVVPVLRRLERGRGLPVGQSLLLVARK
jgi:SAM-dependent methyltransferase